MICYALNGIATRENWFKSIDLIDFNLGGKECRGRTQNLKTRDCGSHWIKTQNGEGTVSRTTVYRLQEERQEINLYIVPNIILGKLIQTTWRESALALGRFAQERI
jgi:hypothetical protein